MLSTIYDVGIVSVMETLLVCGVRLACGQWQFVCSCWWPPQWKWLGGWKWFGCHGATRIWLTTRATVNSTAKMYCSCDLCLHSFLLSRFASSSSCLHTCHYYYCDLYFPYRHHRVHHSDINSVWMFLSLYILKFCHSSSCDIIHSVHGWVFFLTIEPEFCQN